MNAALLDLPVKETQTPPAKPTNGSQVIARGKEIYETTIKALVEPEHRGKYLSINVLSGEYQMHDTLADVALYHHSLPDDRGTVPPRFLMRVGGGTAFKKSGRRRTDG